MKDKSIEELKDEKILIYEKIAKLQDRLIRYQRKILNEKVFNKSNGR